MPNLMEETPLTKMLYLAANLLPPGLETMATYSLVLITAFTMLAAPLSTSAAHRPPSPQLPTRITNLARLLPHKEAFAAALTLQNCPVQMTVVVTSHVRNGALITAVASIVNNCMLSSEPGVSRRQFILYEI
jgi:hypothetical protein